MVLLGGLNALAGPLLGAAAFTWLADTLARVTEYWHAVLGAAILLDRHRVSDGHRRRDAEWLPGGRSERRGDAPTERRNGAFYT